MAILTGLVERPLFARKRYALFLWMVQERSRVMRELTRPKWEDPGLGFGGAPVTINDVSLKVYRDDLY